MASAVSAIQTLYENPGAKIGLRSDRKSWAASYSVVNYSHWIEWTAKPDCPAGFLAQKVKRDFKYRKGGLYVAGSAHSWDWGPEHADTGEYWEIWEVVIAENRVRIYPAACANGNFATSRGVMTLEALKQDTNKYPAQDPANLDYRAHDVFEEMYPPGFQNLALKGTFKIKGSVFFLPAGDRRADDWVARYFQSARRNAKYGAFLGGPLWTRAGNFAKPANDFRVMTRFEAGKFHHVTQEHLQLKSGITPPVIANKPEVRSEWGPRAYPLHRWQTYP